MPDAPDDAAIRARVVARLEEAERRASTPPPPPEPPPPPWGDIATLAFLSLVCAAFAAAPAPRLFEFEGRVSPTILAAGDFAYAIVSLAHSAFDPMSVFCAWAAAALLPERGTDA